MIAEAAHGETVMEGEGMTAPTRDELEAKLAASEARGEAAFTKAFSDVKVELAGLRGDIRELKASSASKGTVISTGIAIFLGMAALLATFLAYGAQTFSVGLDSSAVAQQAAERAVGIAKSR